VRCSECHREMTALFLSFVCDYCDGLRADPAPYQGFVVYRGPRDGHAREEYVFRSLRDAERWRKIQRLEGCEIRKVESSAEFRWRASTGTVRDLELADRLFEIFPDHRYAPAPNRAHVSSTPPVRPAAAAS